MHDSGALGKIIIGNPPIQAHEVLRGYLCYLLGMPGFSVFIPVLNEAAIIRPNVETLLDHLAGLGTGFEIILGSNGSSDGTNAEGEKLAARHERVRFFALPEPGPGAAFAHALTLARFPSLITLDMDLSVNLDFVASCLDLLASNQVVIGSKRQGMQERTMARILGSGLYITCARILLGLPFGDYSIGAKGFQLQTARRFQSLIDHHTAYVGNLIFAAHSAGLKVAEIPVTCTDQRKSRFNLAHEGAYRFWWLAKLFGRYRLLGRKPGEEKP